MLGALSLVGLVPLLLIRLASPVVLFAAALLAVSLPACAFRAAGWLGGAHVLVRASWVSDGTWRLTLADGRDLEGWLLPESRMSPVAIWLCWSLERPDPGALKWGWRGTRTLLILSGDLQPGDFRRLLVRLRLDRSECAAPTAAQANS